MVRQREKGNPDKDKYGTWKQNLPIMYDWIMNHNRGWPSQSCRRGLDLPSNNFPVAGYALQALWLSGCIEFDILHAGGGRQSKTSSTRSGIICTSQTGCVS